MRVLVACEESQEVCKAFRELGHEAYSCDIEPCEWCGSVGGKPDNWVCSLEDDNGYTVTNNHMVVCATANYCPVCGRPLTPEAWAELEKRLRG